MVDNTKRINPKIRALQPTSLPLPTMKNMMMTMSHMPLKAAGAVAEVAVAAVEMPAVALKAAVTRLQLEPSQEQTTEAVVELVEEAEEINLQHQQLQHQHLNRQRHPRPRGNPQWDKCLSQRINKALKAKLVAGNPLTSQQWTKTDPQLCIVAFVGAVDLTPASTVVLP